MTRQTRRTTTPSRCTITHSSGTPLLTCLKLSPPISLAEHAIHSKIPTFQTCGVLVLKPLRLASTKQTSIDPLSSPLHSCAFASSCYTFLPAFLFFWECGLCHFTFKPTVWTDHHLCYMRLTLVSLIRSHPSYCVSSIPLCDLGVLEFGHASPSHRATSTCQAMSHLSEAIVTLLTTAHCTVQYSILEYFQTRLRHTVISHGL